MPRIYMKHNTESHLYMERYNYAFIIEIGSSYMFIKLLSTIEKSKRIHMAGAKKFGEIDVSYTITRLLYFMARIYLYVYLYTVAFIFENSENSLNFSRE